jgi:protein O-mannosyl-transferase
MDKQQSYQRGQVFLLLTAILLVSFLTFSPALKWGFLDLDDDVSLLNNPNVRTFNLTNFKNIFIQRVSEVYTPLTILSYALEYRLVQYQPWLYHLDNLLLYLGVTVLVFCFARMIGLSFTAATIATLFFGIHPQHVEPVSWVTARKDILYSLFYLAALCQYWKFLSHRKDHPATHPLQDRSYLLSLIFGLLSILAKPMALSLPLILLLSDWFSGRRLDRRAWIEKTPFFLMVFLIALVTYIAHARLPGSRVNQSLLIWIWTFMFYLKKFIFPYPLSVIYALPQPVSWGNPSYLITALTFLSLVFLIWKYRHYRLFVFAVSYYFLSIFFLLRFDDNVDITVVADRFMFLPGLGFCLLCGSLCEHIFKRLRANHVLLQKISPFFLLGLIGIFIGIAHSYGQLWGNELALYNHSITHYPAAFYAYRNRGILLQKQRKFDQAMRDFNQAINLKPNFARAYFNRGSLYHKMNRPEPAIADFNHAIKLDARYAPSYNNRAITLWQMGGRSQALEDMNRYLALSPQDAEAYYNRGLMFLEMKMYELAIKDFNRFIKLKNDTDRGYYYRGLAYLKKGVQEKAIADFQQALQIDPNNQRARQQLFSLENRQSILPGQESPVEEFSIGD